MSSYENKLAVAALRDAEVELSRHPLKYLDGFGEIDVELLKDEVLMYDRTDTALSQYIMECFNDHLDDLKEIRDANVSDFDAREIRKHNDELRNV